MEFDSAQIALELKYITDIAQRLVAERDHLGIYVIVLRIANNSYCHWKKYSTMQISDQLR